MKQEAKSLHLVVEDQKYLVEQLPYEVPAEAPIADESFFQAFRDEVREILSDLVPPETNGQRVVLSEYHPDVSVLVYYPKNRIQAKSYPCLYHIHGGGHIAGYAAMYDGNFQKKADQLDVVVVAIDYRLAPENPYPASLFDCFAGFEWIVKNSQALGIDANKVSIMGESAGGCLTAALNLYIRDNSQYQVKSQILIYPMLDHQTSYQPENLENVYCGEYIWTHQLNKIGWKALLGQHDLTLDADKGYYSPALAKNLENLPVTYIAIGSMDLFLSETLEYANRLIKSGVPVSLEVVGGAIHLFDLIASETAEKFNEQLFYKLKKLLF